MVENIPHPLKNDKGEINLTTGKPLRRINVRHVFENGDAYWPVQTPNQSGPAADEPVRPEILKLAKKVTSRGPFYKITPRDAEYWGLCKMLTDEQAKVINYMKVRVPMTMEDFIQKTGMSEEELQPILDACSVSGVIEYNWENPTKTKQYVLPMFVPGSAEFSVMNHLQITHDPELATFFEQLTRLPLGGKTQMVPMGGGGLGLHVIPVEKAIEQENNSVSVEHISHWLDKYDGVYAASPCACRTAERVRGHNAGDDAEKWCIGVGDMASYLVETGKGEYVTREEVLDIIERAEKNGYVHQITNIDGENKIFAICNCNIDVCYALRTSQLFNTPNMNRSAYVAEVEPENCVACGGCAEVCPAGAVKLGQKYPTTEGPIEYPKQELPDEVVWTEEKWNPNYKDDARRECYETGTAPCKVACPAHVPIQGYLKLAAQGRYTEALALIKKENPFPAVCGRVCNKACEAACMRATVDSAVAIDDVKRFIADMDLNADTRYVPEKVIPSNRGEFKQKIAIIGAGPAGLTCAYYLAQKGYRPTVYEKHEQPGGMMMYGIPSYKLQKDVVQAEIDIMRELGVDIKCGVEVGKDVTLDELREQGYDAFYIAIGCQRGNKLNIPGADAKEVYSAVEFLDFSMAHPDNEIDDDTVVIGGGNVAIDAARVSRRAGSPKVTMVCLESREEMPALPEEILEAEEDGVEVKPGWGPVAIRTDADGNIEGVEFKRCTSVFNSEHKFAPEFDETETMFVPGQRVIMSVGQGVEWGNLLEGEKVELGRGNYPLADKVTCQTAQEDIFVGGDVATGPSFLINAVAAGQDAAISLHRFVQKGSDLVVGRKKREYIPLNRDTMVIPDYDHHTRQTPEVEKVVEIHHRWDDPSHTLTEEQIKIETARCLSCGAAVVDQNKCIGCGLCTTRCKFDAIHLIRKHPEASVMTKRENAPSKLLPYAAKRGVKILKNKIKSKVGK